MAAAVHGSRPQSTHDPPLKRQHRRDHRQRRHRHRRRDLVGAQAFVEPAHAGTVVPRKLRGIRATEHQRGLAQVFHLTQMLDDARHRRPLEFRHRQGKSGVTGWRRPNFFSSASIASTRPLGNRCNVLITPVW
ncbi:MAG: hypothetical protein HZA54_05560 [Planctomycetes bacterium]|nr:hypothetical protein [Planctomycetota bacterium]